MSDIGDVNESATLAALEFTRECQETNRHAEPMTARWVMQCRSCDRLAYYCAGCLHALLQSYELGAQVASVAGMAYQIECLHCRAKSTGGFRALFVWWKLA